jgi:hypothetical protein
LKKAMGLLSGSSESSDDSRDRLIREELQFLLEGDERRFGRQLRARLMEEGCNLPLCLARADFYEALIAALAPGLDDEEKRRLAAGLPPRSYPLAHPRFHGTVRELSQRLRNSGPRLAAAAIDAVAAVVATWRIDPGLFTGSPAVFDDGLRSAAGRISAANPRGRLGGMPFGELRRRTRLALCVSLLKYVGDPDAFRSSFGAVPRCLAEMERNPALFSRLMAFFMGRLPHAGTLASQSFWRVLQTLDNEP